MQHRGWKEFLKNLLAIPFAGAYNLYKSGGKSVFFKSKMKARLSTLKETAQLLPEINNEEAAEKDLGNDTASEGSSEEGIIATGSPIQKLT